MCIRDRSKAEAAKPAGQQPSMVELWEAQQQLKRPDTRSGKIRALQESAALFSFMQANGIKTMQQLHDKIAEMNSSYYDLRGKIVQAERWIATLTERGEMWAQYNKYKPIRKDVYKRQLSVLTYNNEGNTIRREQYQVAMQCERLLLLLGTDDSSDCTKT